MRKVEELESEVRSYCRAFPAQFATARGAELFDAEGRRWLDFFAGAGTLNYGHNEPAQREALVRYLLSDGVAHALDMRTDAKVALLEALERRVLAPRGLPHRVQFPGPTGTNAVEAALKLARLCTGRTEVVHFTNSYHGMTLGALAVTGNGAKRRGAGVPLAHATALPFEGFGEVDGLAWFEALLDGPSSGLERPAAVILETVQAEGGVNVASPEWVRRLFAICARHGVKTIVDDVQVGCGRTGPFFSFEDLGVVPDIVCLSKSISGFGLPLALVLLRPELDVWEPGQHNGTFRGNNLAFVTAADVLERYWSDGAFEAQTRARGAHLRRGLEAIAAELSGGSWAVRGRGMILGLECGSEIAARATRRAFDLGLMLEAVGPDDGVLKLLPPLTTPEALLDEGLAILRRALEESV